MLQRTVSLLVYSKRMAYAKKLKKKFKNTSYNDPGRQIQKARFDKAKKMTHLNGGNQHDDRHVNMTLNRMYGSRSSPLAGQKVIDDMNTQSKNVNQLYQLQGVGDDQQLNGEKDFGFSASQMAVYEDSEDMMNSESLPVPYGRKIARKLASGEMWPSAPAPEESMKTVRSLKNREDFSPSQARSAKAAEFWIRRLIKKMPPQYSEHIDFAQLIIEEVIPSKRSQKLLIIWSTVHPGARMELEPHLQRSCHWITTELMKKKKTWPNVPKVRWVYNEGITRELPKTLLKELKAVEADVGTTLKDRMNYLRRQDSLSKLNANVPWFMPYLWSKDEKMKKHHQMLSDTEVWEKQQREQAKDRGVLEKKLTTPKYVQ